MKNLAKPINGGYRQHKMGNVSEIAKAIHDLETKEIKSVTITNDEDDSISVNTTGYNDESVKVGRYERKGFKHMIRENIGWQMGVYLDDYYGISRPEQSSRDLTQEEALYVIVKSYADGKAIELMYRDITSSDKDYMGAGIDEIDGLIGDENIIWQAWAENCKKVDDMLIEFSNNMKPDEAYAQALFDESKAIIENIDYEFDGIDVIDPVEYNINEDIYASFVLADLTPKDIIEAAETMHEIDEELAEEVDENGYVIEEE